MIWLFYIMLLLPTSPGWKLRYALPKSQHLNLLEDIWAFEKKWPNASLAVQSTIGPHIHRNAISIMTQGKCRAPQTSQVNGFPVEFILLSPNVGHYMIDNFDACIQSLENNLKYIRLNTFQHLIVYKRSIN